MAKRVDTCQPEIVAALRKAGVAVLDLHNVGHGCPDVLAATTSRMVLLEFKSAGGHLTPDEATWHLRWPVRVAVVRTLAEALSAVGIEVQRA